MEWQFDSEINLGYPSRTGLSDVCEVPLTSAPFPKLIFCSDGDYPQITMVNLPSEKLTFMPYPLCIMMCLGDEINEGYPVLTFLSGLSMQTETKLKINEKSGRKLCLKGRLLSAAYLADENVYNIIYA